MNFFDLSQFGVAIFAIGAMMYTTKKFLCFSKRAEENFSKIVTNHLHDNAEASHKLQLSNQELSSVIKELLSFLKRNNGK